MWNIPANNNQYVNIVFRAPFGVQCDEQCSLDYVSIAQGLMIQEPEENAIRRRRKKRQAEEEEEAECIQSQYNFAALGVANVQMIPLGDNVVGR